MAENKLSDFFKPVMSVTPNDMPNGTTNAEGIPTSKEVAKETPSPDEAAQDNPYLKITEKISHRNSALLKVALWKMLNKETSGAASKGLVPTVPPLSLPNDQDSPRNLENIFGIPGKMIKLERDLEKWPLTRQFIVNRQETALNKIPRLKNIEEVIKSGAQKSPFDTPSKGIALDEIAERWMEDDAQAKRNTEQNALENKEEPLWLPESVTSDYVGNQLSKGARQVLEEAMSKGIVKLRPRSVNLVPTDRNWVEPTEQGIIKREPEPNMHPVQELNDFIDGLFAITSSVVTGIFGTPIGFTKGVGKSVMDGTYGSNEGNRTTEIETRRLLQNGNFYNPRTKRGWEYLDAFGKIMDFFIPVAPMSFPRGVRIPPPSIKSTTGSAVRSVTGTAGKTAEGKVNQLKAIDTLAVSEENILTKQNSKNKISEERFKKEDQASQETKTDLKSETTEVSKSLTEVLDLFGIDQENHKSFFDGEVVAFEYPTKGGDNLFGHLQFKEGHLTSQLFSIRNTAGGGFGAYLKFVKGSFALAKSLGLRQVEIQGGAIHNKSITKNLLANGYKPKTIPVPEYMGGGTVEVLYKIETISEWR